VNPRLFRGLLALIQVHAIGDGTGNKARGDRCAVIMQDRDRAGRIHGAFVDEQLLQLCVAILFHDEHLVMRIDKLVDVFRKRKRPNSQCVEMQSLRLKCGEGLFHRDGR